MTTDNENVRDINTLLEEEKSGTYRDMTDYEIKSLIEFHKTNEYMRGLSDGRDIATNANIVAYKESNRAQYATMVKRLQDEENALRGDSE